MSQTISLTLPQSTYDRLTAVAEAADSSLEEVLLQTIKNGMPPSLQKVPADFHPLLLALHKFEDPACGRWWTARPPTCPTSATKTPDSRPCAALTPTPCSNGAATPSPIRPKFCCSRQ
jgi:hypothetical protein